MSNSEFWNDVFVATSHKPSASIPVEPTAPTPKFSLDKSAVTPDVVRKFQKELLEDELKVSDVTKWKREEMSSLILELRRIDPSSDMYHQNAKDFTEDPIITTLGKYLSALEPSEITTVSIGSELTIRNQRLLGRQKLLASLKSQVAGLAGDRTKIKSFTKEIKESTAAMNEKLQSCREGMSTACQREMELANLSYVADIDAEMNTYSRVETLASICTGPKIDEEMAEIEVLYGNMNDLASELEFTKVLPPNMAEIDTLVEERKKQYEEICEKVEGLTEYH